MRAVLDIVFIVLDIYIWILVIQAVMSWLLVFGVINARNQFVATVWQFLRAVTEPFLKPIRRILPAFNGLDLSPMVLVLLVILIQRVIIYYVYPNVI